MRRGSQRWTPAASLLLVVATGPVAAAEALEQCLARLSAGPIAPLTRLCPDLRGGGDRCAGQDCAARQTLADLDVMLRQDYVRRLPRYRLDFQGLAQILRDARKPPERPDPWARFRERLERWLERYGIEPRHWFTQWRRHFEAWLAPLRPPESVWRWLLRLFWIAMALVLARLAVRILREVIPRLARRRPPPRSEAPRPGTALPAFDWRRLEGLPPARQAPAVLSHVIAVLAARGLMADRASATYRELQRALPDRPPEAAAAFGALRLAAEAGLYGDRDPPPDALADWRAAVAVLTTRA
ncbi:MAG: hypothetical protein ACREWG_02995 [Gammaproteobacteria bacterium]